ncbi:MAG: Glucose--fructose oxidoreductase precursor [candidate division BRC1 bacterium ADurb.BinA364]|nr:MAG: Glucose--fructose oxidoreductase precursor [candidate division BRC1 bacterium ADurb.BinA364]
MDKQGRLRWGILSTGSIARKVAPSIAKAPRSRVSAVGSRDLARAQAFAADLGIEKAYGTYDALLADPEIDAVYIASPNALHHAHAIQAAGAGKHILCEKPIAATVKAAEAMFKAAEKAGVVLMEAFMYRCHPQMIDILRRVREGEIGRVGLIRSSFCFDIGDKPQNIRLSHALHGGALMDIGCYCINFSRAVANQEPERIEGAGFVGAYGVDEWCAGALGFPGGAAASFTCAVRCQAGATAGIYGSQGFIEIPEPWRAAEPVSRYTLKRSGGQIEEIAVSAPDDRYTCQAEAFAASVLDGAPLAVSKQDSLGNTLVIETLHRSLGVNWDETPCRDRRANG